MTAILLMLTLLLTSCGPVDALTDAIVGKAIEKQQQEKENEKKEEEIRYLRSDIPLREEISISDSVQIADLKVGEKVVLLREEDSWAWVRTIVGQEGYVLSAILSEKPVKVVDEKETNWTYEREGLSIDINKYKDGNLVYWVADVYTEHPDQDINTAFSGGSYETCMETKETTSAMAEQKNAIFAINGDALGFRGDGSDMSDFKNPIVIRNGELCYEDDRNIGRMCAMKKDGTLKVFTPGDMGTAKDMVEDGVTDVWWFDTPLVENGVVEASLYEVEYGLDIAPYTAIGQKDKNNFIFIVVDGRGSNGSPGTTYTGMAELMVKYGAKTAYQLDGGGSSTIWFDGMVLNDPSEGQERAISDIIYVAR